MTTQHEQSFGIIPLRKKGKQWQVLLIQHGAGHWSFPKGHPEKGESPQEAATRELKEETGLTVEEFLPLPEATESYFFFLHGQRIHKTVIYYPALVHGTILTQPPEVQNAKWVLLAEASEQVTFPGAKAICEQVQKTIKE